ncbi:MAG TPA: Glu/Leu/Phe/Val dehydrogenase dimerization domain-containing protein [Conexibacter sp.]|nr:Glu/Leu/Phe/Val dehydrogenase dimerization domain-containing protein [Conexibacter sp.]
MIKLTDAFEHEQLELFRDPATGLTGAVAIHSTALGPSMGGLRIRRYADVEAAAVDALRLARAMTLKNSAAGLRLGGGKAVLIDDGRWEDREARMLAFADVVERLGGRYVTAEDVGTSPADMDLIATRTAWVVGRSPANGGGGDPSPATARTVFGAIEAAVRLQLDDASLAGVHVGVLGAGKVGAALVALLAEAGARVTVADVERTRAEACAAAAPGQVGAVAVDGFLARDLDVLAPCALGELIAAADVAGLRCRIIAGAANNPLVDRATAVALHDAGILYVPDFVANNGGIVHVAAEFEQLSAEALAAQLDTCVAQVGVLLAEARERDALPIDVAVEQALARVAAARAVPAAETTI